MMMTHSLLGADRGTYVRMVLVASAAVLTLIAVGLSFRPGGRDATARMEGYGPVIRAGVPAARVERNGGMVR
jgi:hypothetical protein